jgi:hypothetical protein
MCTKVGTVAVLVSANLKSCVHAGGLGKSTMAKVLFNRLAGNFLHSAFVELQSGDGADKVAQHLAVAVTGLGCKGEAAEGAPALSRKLKDFVKDKSVLFVLDNIWMSSQLTSLLPTEWGAGSRVIITSRFQSFSDSSSWPQVGTASALLCHKKMWQKTMLMCALS